MDESTPTKDDDKIYILYNSATATKPRNPQLGPEFPRKRFTLMM